MLQLVNNEQFLFVHLSLTKGCLLSIMLFIQKIYPFLIGSNAPALTNFVRRMRYLENDVNIVQHKCQKNRQKPRSPGDDVALFWWSKDKMAEHFTRFARKK